MRALRTRRSAFSRFFLRCGLSKLAPSPTLTGLCSALPVVARFVAVVSGHSYQMLLHLLWLHFELLL